MVVIGRLGIIKGGGCEKIFKQRAGRETGAGMVWEDLMDQRCLRAIKDRFTLTKFPKYRGWRSKGGFFTADDEIGYRRVTQDLLPLLLRRPKRQFIKRQFMRWCRQIASFEFGIGLIKGDGPIHEGHVLDPELRKNVRFGYAEPHQGGLYKLWKKGGNE